MMQRERCAWITKSKLSYSASAAGARDSGDGSRVYRLQSTGSRTVRVQTATCTERVLVHVCTRMNESMMYDKYNLDGTNEPVELQSTDYRLS